MLNPSKYWNDFYQNFNINEPSDFAKFVLPTLVELKRPLKVAEIGCGNGRDLLYFAEQLQISYFLGLDFSKTALKQLVKRCTEHSLYNIVPIVRDFTSQPLEIPNVDCFYLRFVLHAIGEKDELFVLKECYNELKSGGLIFIECRSAKLPELSYGKRVGEKIYEGDHQRRLIDKDELDQTLQSLGFKQKMSIEERGLAKNNVEDPLIIRAIYYK